MVEDPGTITTAYGLYALIVVQAFGLIKIFIDRSNTKKERDSAIEILNASQEELKTKVKNMESSCASLVLLQNEVDNLKENSVTVNDNITKLTSSLHEVQLAMVKLTSSVTYLVESTGKIERNLEKLFDRVEAKNSKT